MTGLSAHLLSAKCKNLVVIVVTSLLLKKSGNLHGGSGH